MFSASADAALGVRSERAPPSLGEQTIITEIVNYDWSQQDKSDLDEDVKKELQMMRRRARLLRGACGDEGLGVQGES